MLDKWNHTVCVLCVGWSGCFSLNITLVYDIWSCLENPWDGGAWWAAVYGVAQSQTQLKWLSRDLADDIWT